MNSKQLLVVLIKVSTQWSVWVGHNMFTRHPYNKVRRYWQDTLGQCVLAFATCQYRAEPSKLVACIDSFIYKNRHSWILRTRSDIIASYTSKFSHTIQKHEYALCNYFSGIQSTERLLRDWKSCTAQFYSSAKKIIRKTNQSFSNNHMHLLMFKVKQLRNHDRSWNKIHSVPREGAWDYFPAQSSVIYLAYSIRRPKS